MSKKKKPEPVPFVNKDEIREEIDGYLTQASKLHAQLEPHKTSRGFIGCTNKKGDYAVILFKGTVEDVFLIKEFIEEMDKSNEEKSGESQ